MTESANPMNVEQFSLSEDQRFAFFGGFLLQNNALGHKEAVATLKNVMEALGFYREGYVKVNNKEGTWKKRN